MAKQSIKEVKINSHVLSATGVLEISESGVILNTEDFGPVDLNTLLKNFSGEQVMIKVATKEEE